MSEKPSYFKLGLFVIVSIAIFLAGVAVLGAGALLKPSITAETYMEESVQGLDVGAPVKHRGVQIGKVSRIAFLGEEYEIPPGPDGKLNMLVSYVYVEMELDVERRGKDRNEETFKKSIKSGMHARLTSSGLVGTVFVDLYFPTEEPSVQELTWEPRHLYVPSTKSVIAELTATASRIARQLEDAKLDTMARDIGRLVNSVEQKVSALDVEKFQGDAMAFIEEVRESNRRVQEILENPAIKTTLDNMAATSDSLKRITGGGETDLATFIKDLPEISARLKSSAAEIEAVLKDEKTRKIIDDVSKTAELAPGATAEARRLIQRLGTILSSQQADLEIIVQQLRKTTENLRKITEDASDNPSRLLFGDPPPTVRPGSREGNR